MRPVLEKKIVRSKHFISFFKEFHASHLDINSFLEKKSSEFFDQNENKVINRNDRQWSHRKLMIFYDLLSENGGIWDSGHENVALRKNKDSESKKMKFILDRRQSGKEQDTMTQKSKSVFQRTGKRF